MKKLLVAISITILSFNFLKAQEKGDIELGGNIGVNFSNVTLGRNTFNNSNLSTDHTTGFNIALTGEYYFSDRWGIKTKLIYDQKGWGNGFLDNYDTGERVISDYELSYFTIPVLANWHFGSNRNWYLNFGLYAGFLIDVNLKDISTNIELMESFETTDIGLALGIGYKFQISENTRLFFEFDGQSGFNSINKENNGENITNSRSSINFGALFFL
ncbi:porin family protein [Tenacibaculum sp. C7A-26P2]|uniref:porin family protein n=1 Tax=Tenacibaculum sp. C7A-26P2 TaxID=3447504 RepID=UPI003F84911A